MLGCCIGEHATLIHVNPLLTWFGRSNVGRGTKLASLCLYLSPRILLMEEIMHQLIGSYRLSMVIPKGIQPRWCRIFFINSISCRWEACKKVLFQGGLSVSLQQLEMSASERSLSALAPQDAVVQNRKGKRTYRIHVCHVYQHFVHFYGKCW